jgi:hypothetical protein
MASGSISWSPGFPGSQHELAPGLLGAALRWRKRGR